MFIDYPFAREGIRVVNVNNLFYHYLVGILPNNGSGYTNLQNLQATFYGQPRVVNWTNTFSF